MPKSVFISYCHKQGKWVWDRLVPCLRAGGADVHIDRERFEVVKAVVGQMDAVQDGAEMAVLVLSPEYLNSPYCVHEMDRAIRRDPTFAHGIVVPVKRTHCELPAKIKRPKPLYVDLQDDSNADQWRALLRSCEGDLGTPAPHWLDALHETCRFLRRGDSVNRSVTRLAIIHFDMVRFRSSYDVNLFGTLRNLMMDSRKLVLLIESREFFANLLPAGHPLSSITTIKTVELNGLP